MADIKKFERSSLPALPQMFGNLAPLDIPEMDFSKGMVANYFHKKKLKQVTESKKMRAEIAEYEEREVNANANRLTRALMFGREYELLVAQNESAKKMLILNEYEKQEIVRGYVLKNEEQTIKNNILRKEEKDLDFTLNMKYKDMGYDFTNEAGE